MRHTIKKPELLMPAGNLETLKAAVLYGADAVYIGGEALSLRAKADNFDEEAMREGICFAHAHGARVYVTVNVFAHDEDLAEAEQLFPALAKLGPDALIISDPGLFRLAKRLSPELEIHISTQSNNTNYETFRFWQELGASRVVAARELTLSELSEIKSKVSDTLEIEAFVHGAMCISYSGRCLLSAALTGREANRGACTHPCRWNYRLVEEKRPGEYFPVIEEERGTYILNSRDLAMIGHIPELLQSRIDSFKVEGRMKTLLYVATVARAYRKAIDDCLLDEALYRRNLPLYLEEIGKCTHRAYGTGFYFGKPDASGQIYENSAYLKEYTYLGLVQELRDGCAVIRQKNKFSVGEEAELMSPGFKTEVVKVLGIRDLETGEELPSCPHASQMLLVRLDRTPAPFDILRIRRAGE